MIDKYILDSCALIALISKENGGEYVFNLIRKAINKEVFIYMHRLNLLEVFYHLHKKYDDKKATNIYNYIKSLPIKINSVISDDIFNQAGRLKILYKMSIADSIGLAESMINNGYFVTADHHELDKIPESENIRFAWIR